MSDGDAFFDEHLSHLLHELEVEDEKESHSSSQPSPARNHDDHNDILSRLSGQASPGHHTTTATAGSPMQQQAPQYGQAAGSPSQATVGQFTAAYAWQPQQQQSQQQSTPPQQQTAQTQQRTTPPQQYLQQPQQQQPPQQSTPPQYSVQQMPPRVQYQTQPQQQTQQFQQTQQYQQYQQQQPQQQYQQQQPQQPQQQQGQQVRTATVQGSQQPPQPQAGYQVVMYNGQYYQVPNGMQMAQVGPNGQLQVLSSQQQAQQPQQQQYQQPQPQYQQQQPQQQPQQQQRPSYQTAQYQYQQQPQQQQQQQPQYQVQQYRQGQPQQVQPGQAQVQGQQYGQQQQQGVQMMMMGPNGQLMPYRPQGQQQQQQVQQPQTMQYQQQGQQQQRQGVPQGIQMATYNVGGRQVQLPAGASIMAGANGQMALTVPPGMTAEQFVALLQAQGLTGQVMSQGLQQLPQQPQQQPQQQVQQQQRPATPPQQAAQTGFQVQGFSNQSQQPPQQQQRLGQPQPSQQQRPPTPPTSAYQEDLTRLNPKATPFVPKTPPQGVGATPPQQPPAQQAQQQAAPAAAPAAAAAAPPRKEGTITCPHCSESNFLTEYVLRSHIKAKHSAESQLAAAAENTAVVKLNNVIRNYLTTDCNGGSVSVDTLSRWLEGNHAVLLGEASAAAKTLNDILTVGNFRRFAYTADELSRAEITPEIARPNEGRVALPNTDYMKQDGLRSKESGAANGAAPTSTNGSGTAVAAQ